MGAVIGIRSIGCNCPVITAQLVRHDNARLTILVDQPTEEPLRRLGVAALLYENRLQQLH